MLEFYNPLSIRTLVKRIAGPAPIAEGTTDRDVYTRYDTAAQARTYLPPDTELVAMRGIRVLTPSSGVFRVPALGRLFAAAEHLVCDAPLLRHRGGFLVLVVRKSG
jgi:hypothetical protein